MNVLQRIVVDVDVDSVVADVVEEESVDDDDEEKEEAKKHEEAESEESNEEDSNEGSLALGDEDRVNEGYDAHHQN
jgi:hypothetical protein